MRAGWSSIYTYIHEQHRLHSLLANDYLQPSPADEGTTEMHVQHCEVSLSMQANWGHIKKICQERDCCKQLPPGHLTEGHILVLTIILDSLIPRHVREGLALRVHPENNLSPVFCACI